MGDAVSFIRNSYKRACLVNTLYNPWTEWQFLGGGHE
jgi:hypothetical protein